LIEILFVLSLVIVSALLAVTSRNIVYAVLALLSTNITLSIAYYMMGAPTVALFQLAIFAGAVVVFFVITIMLTTGGDIEFDDNTIPWMNKKIQLALSIISVQVLLGIAVTREIEFPLMKYALSTLETLSLVPSTYDDITTAVSQFLWQNRGLDLVGQSFVVVTAVICCVAMLKIRRSNE
jgi:NADH:ubiquinone oxidoreductase subunit 6 (subunit J)